MVTEHHRDSIVQITSHAPVFEGHVYQDYVETRGAPIDCHMVTSSFCHRRNDHREWIHTRLTLQRLSCLISGHNNMEVPSANADRRLRITI